MTIYSHSRLNCFENCPKAYWFSYIEKPKIERKEGIEAFVGSRVHETLEKHYTELKLTKLNSLKALLSFYEKQWEKNWNENIVVVKKDLKPKHYFDLGKKCIEKYYQRHKPFDKDKTIACEKKISIDLDESGQYKMRGFIDRLAEEEPGHYVIHDYKTSGSLPMQDYLDQDRQLALYSIAVYNDFTDCDDVNLCWHYLVFDKDLFSSRSGEQLDKLKQDMIALIQKVEKAELEQKFPTKESRLCDWCQYSELCPTKAHETKTEKMKVREFKKDEGVKLVNKFVELNGRLAEAGSEAALKIYKSMSYSFAGLEKEEKEELEEMLKKEKILNDFLALDTRALGAAIAKQKLKKATENKIKKFGQEKETKGIRLVKK